MDFKNIVLLGVIFSAVSSCSDAQNDLPVIGVLSQSTAGKFSKFGDAYIAASYVKFLESAGARVVPVLINQPGSYYEEMFAALNAVVFPGGGLPDLLKTGYGKAGRAFYDLAIKSYDKSGDHFPVWGTCLGMQLLVGLTSNKYLLASMEASDISYPLDFAKGFHDSRLFHGADQSVVNILAKENVTFNSHHFGLTPTNFSKNEALSTFYRVLSTNVDKKGVTFISSMEALYYPIYGVQFHPEKNAFEWKSKNINHSSDAITIMQYFANFLVGEARKNYHSFSGQTLSNHLIYNHAPVYTGNISSFEQCYFFDLESSKH